MHKRLKSSPPVVAVRLSVVFTSLTGALLPSACGPKFEGCEAHRRCQGGGSGDSGSGGDGESDPNSTGGMLGLGGTAGSSARSGAGGMKESGGSSNGGADRDTPAGEGGSDAGGGGSHAGHGATNGGTSTAEPSAGAGEGGTPDAVLCDEHARPPRLIAPLSTALVTSRRPTVEIERGDDCGRLMADFCSDRACTKILASVGVGADATAIRPPDDLPQGVAFWRARSGEKTSYTWQFTIGKGTTVDTWWGTIPDFNGDGKVDVAVGTSNGTVFVYYGDKDGLGAKPPTRLQVGGAGVVFGAAFASAGDVNGDGFADLLLTASAKPAGEVGSRLYIYAGGPNGIETAPLNEFDLEVDNRWSTGRGGADINGDGYGDFVVTIPRSTMPGSYRPFWGGLSGSQTSREIVPGSSNHGFGSAIAVCDLDADRRVDMVIGSPGRDSTTEDQSVVQLFKGVGARFEIEKELSVADKNHFADQVACGDFSNDGFPDVVVSDPYSIYRGGNAYEGDVFLFPNSSGTVSATGLSIQGQASGELVGSGARLKMVGDMTGDGFPELAVGQNDQIVRIMFGLRDPSALDFVEIGGVPDVDDGFSRAMTGGDVDGDGLSDLIVASPTYQDRGRLTIFRGSRTSRIISPSSEHIDAPEGVTGFGTVLSAGL